MPSSRQKPPKLINGKKLRSTDIDALFHKRDLELRRNSKGREAYLAYISEGISKRQDWEMVMKYQRKNRSLFNSPSATAAALSHLPNAGFHYLTALIDKFENAGYSHTSSFSYLSPETIESLGIIQHFREEITSVLDKTYRYSWIHSRALAFRILHVNGYNVSSEPLGGFAEGHFFNSLGGYLKDLDAVVELFRASQFIVNDALEFPHYQVCRDFLRLAVEDYNACQSMYREELKQLERWGREKRLDKLKFSRQKLAYCHFSAAATICFKENGSIVPRQCKELFWKLCKVLHFTSHEPTLVHHL
ncbi:hypothetical protein PVK06_025555 [Gossypium arboreum]|uniref:Terpene synthase N-terminal domain-containing protein n=1 Tax=Gossypium arboreum TaxID=29729 RepID=A0ABR0PH62_GOSAR|nr:hypothetical protein PVK06_025555 [Gossypium arboreum]